MSNELSKRQMSRAEHARLHELLHTFCTHLPTDFEPYGQRSRETDWGPDCSCGCRHFLELKWPLGADWGVCANQRSPRAGLLTFEHQGCREFEEDERIDEDILRWVAERPDVFKLHDRNELLAQCAQRAGLDWETMSEAERQQFTEQLLKRQTER